MGKEASRIHRIVSRVRMPEDLVELVKMAQSEVLRGLVTRDSKRLELGAATYEAACEALANASVRAQLPRYTQAT